jgi:biotin-(acetyl-CoA carboxylase) ligase
LEKILFEYSTYVAHIYGGFYCQADTFTIKTRITSGHKDRMNHVTELTWVETTDSTNMLAKAYWHQYAPRVPMLFAAGQQTQGRGTQGRVWASPPGCGLYLTILWPEVHPVAAEAASTVLLTQAVGTWVCEWVQQQGWQAPGFGLKPVNDVMVGRKKLGGILVERVLQGHTSHCVFIGVGLNVITPYPLPTDYPERAIALDMLPTKPEPPFVIRLLAQSLGNAVIHHLKQPEPIAGHSFSAWVQAWRSYAG